MELIVYEQYSQPMERNRLLQEILPQTLSVLKTRAIPIGVELVVGNHEDFNFSDEYYGAIVQYPGKHGQIFDYTSFIGKANANNIKVVNKGSQLNNGVAILLALIICLVLVGLVVFFAFYASIWILSELGDLINGFLYG